MNQRRCFFVALFIASACGTATHNASDAGANADASVGGGRGAAAGAFGQDGGKGGARAGAGGGAGMSSSAGGAPSKMSTGGGGGPDAGAAADSGGTTSLPATTVVVYPAPAGTATSPDFSVSASGKSAFVYRARVQTEHLNWPDGKARWDADTQTLAGGGSIPDDRYASMTYFDMAGSVDLVISATQSFTSVDVRPKQLGLVATVQGNTIKITLPQPAKFTVELVGTAKPVNALHVFANALEKDAPASTDAHVRYYGPGVHDVGNVDLASDDVVYVAGGAIVHGTFNGSGLNNVTVRGRGILADAGQIIKMYKCTNVVVDGVIVLNSSWSINPAGCNGVHISDVKIINGVAAGDGIDIVQSQNVTIDDAFLRTWDDSITVKGYSSAWGLGNDVPAMGVTVTHTVHWNDFGGSLVIGGETECNVISGITWKDIDIIRHYQGGSISATGTNQAAISNVRYEDIRIDDVPINSYFAGNVQLILPTGSTGSISGVYLKNVAINAPADATQEFQLESILQGLDATHNITNVTFDHVSLNGKLWAAAADGHLHINADVSNVVFITN